MSSCLFPLRFRIILTRRAHVGAFVVFLALGVIHVRAAPPAPQKRSIVQDHLVLLDLEIGGPTKIGRYNQIWRDKLNITSADVVRFVNLPAFDLEYAVTIRPAKVKDSNGAKFIATVTQPTQSIWPRLSSDAKTDARLASTIAVRESVAAIPTFTAEAVQKVWCLALSTLKPAHTPEPITTDFNLVIFGAKCKDGQRLVGQLPKTAGPMTDRLFSLGMQLAEYCAVPEQERPARAREIQRASAALFARISKAQEDRKRM